VVIYGRFNWLYQVDKVAFLASHQVLRACLSRAFATVRMPDAVGWLASLVGSEGDFASASARRSASSFPRIPVCPGDQRACMSYRSIAPWQAKKAHWDEAGALPLMPQITEVLSMHIQIR
jgi:hypothetical protein